MAVSRSTCDRILCTDLDGTFIGDDSSMYELLRLIKNRGILLIFSTGRHLPSLNAYIDEKRIRKPDACILMVGTEVYFLSNGEFIGDDRWKAIISQGWDREKMVQLLADINELVLQDEQWQTEFKLSYYLRNNAEGVLNEVYRRMQKANLKAQVIYSGSQFLDFLPRFSGKARALQYVSNSFRIRENNVIVCGDSGNDLDMFRVGFKGVIVGNAYTELKDYNGNNAYHATKEYSAGIIEGLRHFDFI